MWNMDKIIVIGVEATADQGTELKQIKSASRELEEKKGVRGLNHCTVKAVTK